MSTLEKKSKVNNPEECQMREQSDKENMKVHATGQKHQASKIADISIRRQPFSPVGAVSKLDVLRKQFLISRCFKYVVQALPKNESIRLQGLCRYFYNVQMPRCIQACPSPLFKHRLHLLNDDHIIVFDLLAMTKNKVQCKWEAGFEMIDQCGQAAPVKEFKKNEAYACNLWNS